MNRFFSMSIALFLSAACLGRATAGEPDDQPATNDSPQDVLNEGLGFSIAPHEGGKGRTTLFGIVGEGYKFAYVLDRSGSMGGSGANALNAVKAELLASLKNLDSVHQFQIIFYNERPVVFNPSGNRGQLTFATDRNKHRAERFLDSIAAEGGTAHEEALRAAIRLQPDVIFFLTDADEPKLEPAELAKLHRMAAGVVINTIEFGTGPRPDGQENFLVELARENGGQYVYIDISSLGQPESR